MRYQPTDLKDRSHVGEKWNRYFLRSMQIILQATHGVVSGSPEFFRRAFGTNTEEFEALLLRPEKYLFNRAWYEELGGKSEFAEFSNEFRRLSESDRQELACLLSSTKPSKFVNLSGMTANIAVRRILAFYRPLADAVEENIWRQSKLRRSQEVEDELDIPADELVEDAGLAEAA